MCYGGNPPLKQLETRRGVSQATIYNTLNQPLSAGLLSEVIVDHARSSFDTNVTEHPSFLYRR